MTTTYTVSDAIEMLRKAEVDLAKEASNVPAAYADITDEIERAGGVPDFGIDEFRAALTQAAAPPHPSNRSKEDERTDS